MIFFVGTYILYMNVYVKETYCSAEHQLWFVERITAASAFQMEYNMNNDPQSSCVIRNVFLFFFFIIKTGKLVENIISLFNIFPRPYTNISNLINSRLCNNFKMKLQYNLNKRAGHPHSFKILY